MIIKYFYNLIKNPIYKFNFINGSSSLLFIISTIKAYYSTKLILWKIYNCLLIFSSFLCNSTNYEKKYLLLDYITIYLLCTAYINNNIINSSLLILFTNNIILAKDISFILAVTKSIIYTYLYLDTNYLYIIFSVSIIGCGTYKLRSLNYFIKYNLCFTYIWHVCVTTILYISSMNMIENSII